MNQFFGNIPFSVLLKHQKTKCFPIFSGDIKRLHRPKTGWENRVQFFAIPRIKIRNMSFLEGLQLEVKQMRAGFTFCIVIEYELVMDTHLIKVNNENT